jgi:DNA-binding transcriptional MerR regulator
VGRAMMKKNNHQNKMISVKEIMRKYGISYQTVNHYTDFGLLPVLLKKGNVRFYDKDMVEERFKKIQELMEEGYSLHLIRKKLIGI